MFSEEDFDAPLFKVLAHNDTGKAVGHQGGVYIPKELDPYFPQLSMHVSSTSPTVDQHIVAELFDGDKHLETVETRYQYQTWGATRLERRLTGNLGAVLNLASSGDILLIRRGIIDEQRYQLVLIRNSTPGFSTISTRLAGKRWGPLDPSIPPVKEVEVERAISAIRAHEAAPFALFDTGAMLTEGRTVRIARSRAFQTRVNELYGSRCAMCGCGLVHPAGRSELEAAHIVPRRLKGSDDPRNGLQLCRSHHWAFDAGMIGVDAGYRLVVPPSVRAISQNKPLADLSGRSILLPGVMGLRPHLDALAWHRSETLLT